MISPVLTESKTSLIKISLLFICMIFFSGSLKIYAQDTNSVVRAGLRSSTYGINPFPDTTWWYNVTTDMAARYPGSSPAVIWILGYIVNNNYCSLDFPNPNPGTSYNKISFSSIDRSESYLDAFDRSGVKVWLQVEPGDADISTLIDLVLTKYSHHPSVIGFGVDVEWYKTSSANNDEGEAVTDEEAEAWCNKIKSYNENYLLFTKHWLVSKMPPTFRDDIVFVDDSQIFPDMESMVDEFEVWGKAFAPANVTFQYGYNSDKPWWSKLSDPPKIIGDEILKRCSNVSDLYWVDFTAYDIWSVDFDPTSVSDKNVNTLFYGYALNQNYPNPFNPSTQIEFSIPKTEHVVLKIYDLLGREITTLLNEEKIKGTYKIKFNAESLSSGIYYYRITAGMFTDSKKFILLK